MQLPGVETRGERPQRLLLTGDYLFSYDGEFVSEQRVGEEVGWPVELFECCTANLLAYDPKKSILLVTTLEDKIHLVQIDQNTLQTSVTTKRVPEVPSAAFYDDTHGLVISVGGQMYSVDDVSAPLFACCARCVKYSGGFSLDSAGRLSKSDLFFSASWTTDFACSDRVVV